MAASKRGFIPPKYLSNPSPTNSSEDRRPSMTLNRGAGRRVFTSCSWKLPDEQPPFKYDMAGGGYPGRNTYGSSERTDRRIDMAGDNYLGRNKYRSTERTDRQYEMTGDSYSGRNTYRSTERTDRQYDMDGGGYSGRNTYGSTERTDWQKSYIPDNYADEELFGSGNRMDEQYDMAGDSYPGPNEYSTIETMDKPSVRASVEGPCTLYLRGMKKNTTNAKIRSHFEKYGTVVGVQCEKKTIARSYLKGQVTFSDPFMAERAYLDKVHFISKARVTLSPYSNFKDYYTKKFRNKMSLELYVCGFDRTTSEEALHQYFAHFGDIYKLFIEDAFLEIRGGKRRFPSAVGRILFGKLFVDYESFISDDHYLEGNRLEVSYSPFTQFYNNPLREFLLKNRVNKNRAVVKEQTTHRPPLMPASEVSLKSYNKTDGRCETFNEDPHDVCVFCRALGLSTFSPCYESPECEKCASVTKRERNILKKLWIAQSQDMEHPCYWNLSRFRVDLQPAANLTADTFDCTLCLMTLGLSIQEVASHFHSDIHKKNSHRRVEVTRNLLMKEHEERMGAYRAFMKKNAISNFCFVCLRRFSTKSKTPHETCSLHRLFPLLRMHSCDACELTTSPAKTIGHYYSQKHLKNTWHDMILNGDADVSDKLPSHSLTGIIGADLIRYQRAGYCEACAGLFSTDKDGSLFAHCKTNEHFKNYKLLLQKKKVPVTLKNEAEVEIDTE